VGIDGMMPPLRADRQWLSATMQGKPEPARQPVRAASIANACALARLDRAARCMNTGVEIQPADKALRVRVLAACLVAAVAGAFGLVVFRNWLDATLHMPAAAALQSLLWVLAVVSASAAALLIALGIHLWRLGLKVRRAGRFPLPGAHVLRDTVVLRQGAAVRRGKAFQVVGGVLALGAVTMLVASWRVIEAFAIRAA
jgi:hypothetical protein